LEPTPGGSTGIFYRLSNQVENPEYVEISIRGVPARAPPTGESPTEAPPQEIPVPPDLPGVIAVESNRDKNPEIYLQNAADGIIPRMRDLGLPLTSVNSEEIQEGAHGHKR
jgi:hypothetical protein